MQTLAERRFYVYAWFRADGTPYYIGKGTRARRFSKRGRRGAMPPADKSCNRIILPGLTDAESAEAEKDLISILGRKDLGTGCLRNLTDGGEGVCNLTPAARQAISESMRSHPRGGSVKGTIRTEETKRKISEAHARRVALLREQQGLTSEDLAMAKRRYHREYKRRQTALAQGFETYEEYMQSKQNAKEAKEAAKAQRVKAVPKTDEERKAENRARNRAYYQANQEKEIARAREYRAANPMTDETREARKAYDAAYRLANLERLRAYDRERHARSKA